MKYLWTEDTGVGLHFWKLVKSYIERIQATIPGATARKSAAIRTQLRLI